SDAAAAEARERCFHCGVCTHCDICLNVCPTAAITQVDGAYRIDSGKCTAWFECPSLKAGPDGLVDIDRRTCIDCGVCIQVCAQGAIRPRQAQTAELHQ